MVHGDEFVWSGSSNNANEPRGLTEEDWEQLNKIIGYKEAPDEVLSAFHDDMDLPQLFLEIHMKHNASKLIAEGQNCLADLSCEGLVCSLKTYSEAKVFNLKLGSYKLSSPYGLLAKNATVVDSLVRIFSYKPFDAQVDWNFAAKASPCYITVHERKETGEVDVLTKARKGLLCNRMKTGGRKTKT